MLAPSTLQEAVDLTQLAFDLAFKYRNPVMVLADGFMGQMMEAVEIKEYKGQDYDVVPWALGNMEERGKRAILKSLHLDPEELEQHNIKLNEKYKKMQEEEVRYEEFYADDADVLIAAFGTTARIWGVVEQERTNLAKNENWWRLQAGIEFYPGSFNF